MLDNCTGLKNFDEKQDFVKKKIVVFCLKNTPKRKNASKRKMQIKPLRQEKIIPICLRGQPNLAHTS